MEYTAFLKSKSQNEFNYGFKPDSLPDDSLHDTDLFSEDLY